MAETAFIVALWHADPRYTLHHDAVGGKAYKRESSAKKHADTLNDTTNYGRTLHPDSLGFVVRTVTT